MTSDDGKKDAATFDVRFDLELIAAVIVPDDKPTKKKKEKSKGATKGKEETSDEDSKPRKGKATADSVNVYDLPIPKDATDIERKEVAVAASGILASKFPVPDKATDVERNADTEMVTLRSKLSAKEIVEFYGKSLTKLGWKENKDETLLIEAVETGSMSFTKGDDALQIVIQDGKPMSRTRVVVLGSGLEMGCGGRREVTRLCEA